MESIREMVDVNTVVGDPVATQDGSTIIPVSRVSFGFVAGGGEYAGASVQMTGANLPFAGGAGAATLATAGITAAASLLMTLPVVVIFVIMQRKVIETMTYAGIKG